MSSKKDLKDQELENVSGGTGDPTQKPEEEDQPGDPQAEEKPGGARLRPGHDYRRD